MRDGEGLPGQAKALSEAGTKPCRSSSAGKASLQQGTDPSAESLTELPASRTGVWRNSAAPTAEEMFSKT